MTLFRLDASIFPTFSASRALGDIVESEWAAAHPDDAVIRHDLSASPVDAGSWPAAVTAKQTPVEQRTAAQLSAVARATSIADDLLSADALLFDVPLYNFGVSQHFKTWFDLAYTDPRIDPQGTALRGKPAVLVTVLGGNYNEGTPKEGWDHSTGWLRRVLEDVWGLDLTVVQRQFTLVGVNPALDQFADLAADIKAIAESEAHIAGRSLAEAVVEAQRSAA
jgi:FMN-dependent NADH-azoreductase